MSTRLFVLKRGDCAARASLGLFVVLTALAAGTGARAEDTDNDGREDGAGRLMLALDLEYATAISNDFVQHGSGGAFRIGSELDAILVTLIPELTVDYHSFGGRSDPSVVTGKVGGRIRFLKILEPGIFAHLGVGHISADPFSHTGVAFDAGATLDLTILPLIDFGVHAAWNRVFGDDERGLSFGTLGGHVALVF